MTTRPRSRRALQFWLTDVESLAAEYGERLVSAAEFHDAFVDLVARGDSPVEASLLDFCSPQGKTIFTVGAKPPHGRPPLVTSEPLGPAARETSVCVRSVWIHRDTALPDDIAATIDASLQTLIRAFWKPHTRDAKTDLIFVGTPGVAEMITRTLAAWTEGGQHCYLWYCDLDNFKRVNSEFGHDGGDRVIFELARQLEATVSLDATVIHRSGDEFAVLHRTSGAEETLELAWRVSTAVRLADFRLGWPLELSIGISDLELQGDSAITYASIEKRAEGAVEPRPGDKQRGTARFGGAGEFAGRAVDLAQAVSFAKSTVDNPCPFDSVWLNAISRISANALESGFPAVRSTVVDFLAWAKLRLQSGARVVGAVGGDPLQTVPEMGAVDVCLAIVHGMWRGWLQNGANTPPVDVSLLSSESAAAARLRLETEPPEFVDIGAHFVESEVRTLGGWLASQNGDVRTARAILVQLGRQSVPLPLALFADTIVVDDRPTREGGLPDFWEAALARLFSHVASDSRPWRVYVLGDSAGAPETASRLQDLTVCIEHADLVAARIGLPRADIVASCERLEGAVVFLDSSADLVRDLEQFLRVTVTLGAARQSRDATSTTHRFLDRTPRLDDLRLLEADGFRVPTVAQAFPLAVEVVRRAPDTTLARDQLGRTARELLDFKIRVVDPARDLVPAFYADSRQALESYYTKQFESSDGIFRRGLDADDQLHRVMLHVATVLRTADSPDAIATRRGVLVVPTESGSVDQLPPAEIAPPQLLVLRVAPRLSDGHIVMHVGLRARV